jgi:hypothetical protein
VYLVELLIQYNLLVDPKHEKWKTVDACFKSHLKYNCLAVTSCLISRNSGPIKRKELYDGIVADVLKM